MIEQYLERLFTWESLENTERGVEFELKNRLVEAEFQGITRVALDGESVPLEDVTLEFSADERYAADEITPERPLEFDLAETVQVICDVERLRLGIHELEMGLRVEGYGEVGFTTDDEVTEADLVDVDPADLTVAELEALTAEIREPKSFERLLERERDGKDRKTAVETLEAGFESAEPLTEDEMVRTEVSERDAGGGIVGELLTEVLESPQRVSVYLAVRGPGGATPADVAALTVFPESTVRSTLEDFEAEGIAEERDDGSYSVASPITVLQKRQNQLWTALKNTL